MKKVNKNKIQLWVAMVVFMMCLIAARYTSNDIWTDIMLSSFATFACGGLLDHMIKRL